MLASLDSPKLPLADSESPRGLAERRLTPQHPRQLVWWQTGHFSFVYISALLVASLPHPKNDPKE
jgi:hypothetical protein